MSRTCPDSIASKPCPMAACASARWSATPSSLTTPRSPGTIRRSPRRCSRARRRSCAMPRPSAATSCSERAAAISMTPQAPATSARPAPAATRAHGENRLHAVLGWSDACIATHPSDFCVPLVALDAVVEIEGRGGRREVSLESFHRLPGDTPERDSVLEPGDLIVAVRLPGEARTFAAHARYLKLRERTSYAFAVVSAAAAPQDRARRDQAGAARARRRRRKTVARARGGGHACEFALPTRPLIAGQRLRRWPTRDLPATTPSRSSSRNASSCAP